MPPEAEAPDEELFELRPGAEEQILDYARFRLADRQDAARIAALSDTCADLFVHARGLPPEQIQRQSLPQGQIPTGDAIRLAVLDDNESTLITEGGAAVTLLMLCKRTPAGRWGRVEGLGGAAVFLASSASDFVNGQVIYVDGGLTSVV